MNHYFNKQVAVEYGINEALILSNIHFWVELNSRNGRNLHDGEYWMFLTVEEMHDYFPYLSEKLIRKALNTLKEKGLIRVGHFNKKAYDRTNWYTVTPLGARYYAMCTNGIHRSVPKGHIDVSQKDTPIPDINKYIINKEDTPPKPMLKFGENVKLTDRQYEKLISRFGKEAASRAIDYLDKYYARVPAAYSDNYLAVLKWAYPNMSQCEQKRQHASNVYAKSFMELAEEMNK